MEIKISLGKPSKKLFVSLGAIIVLFGLVLLLFLFFHSPKTPIPESVFSQASFKTVYPSDISSVKGQKKGFAYQPQQKSLVYTSDYQGKSLNIIEQNAPSNLANGTGVYFQSLGLHPIAQFNSKLGPVAIISFFNSGSLDPVGQSGILVAGKTMVIASTADSKAKLSLEQWKSFFDSLNQAK